MFQRTPLTRREMLTSAAFGLLSLPSLASLAWASRRKTFDEPKRNPYRGSDDQLLDEVERAAFDFFWNEASSTTGQVRDRARCCLAAIIGELPVLRQPALDSAACASANLAVTGRRRRSGIGCGRHFAS